MDDPKMVPESDLIALKESHATAIKDLETGHTSATETATAEHDEKSKVLESEVKTARGELDRLRADNSRLEEAGKTHASTTEERNGLKEEIEAGKKTLKEAEDGLRSNLADQLTAGYGIPESALKDKTAAELGQIFDVLKKAKSPNSNQYTTGGGSGGEPPKSGRDKIKAGLEGDELRRM
jgi:chromosome segregation ATPase